MAESYTEQLAKLQEALIKGNIDEPTYTRLKADLQSAAMLGGGGLDGPGGEPSGFKRPHTMPRKRYRWAVAGFVALLVIAAIYLTALVVHKRQLQEAQLREAADRELIKQSLSRAAGIPLNDFGRLASSDKMLSLVDLDSHQLSWVLMLTPYDVGTNVDADAEQLRDEFHLASNPPSPSRIIEAMMVSDHAGYASLIQPYYIKGFHCSFEADNTARGTVSVHIENCLNANIHFVARRRDGEWTIVEFSLPVSQIKTVLQPDGKWRAEGEGIAPAVVARLPEAESLPKREQAANRFVITVGQRPKSNSKSSVRAGAKGEVLFSLNGLVTRVGTAEPLLREQLDIFCQERKTPLSNVVLVVRADKEVPSGLVQKLANVAGRIGVRQAKVVAVDSESVRLGEFSIELTPHVTPMEEMEALPLEAPTSIDPPSLEPPTRSKELPKIWVDSLDSLLLEPRPQNARGPNANGDCTSGTHALAAVSQEESVVRRGHQPAPRAAIPADEIEFPPIRISLFVEDGSRALESVMLFERSLGQGAVGLERLSFELRDLVGANDAGPVADSMVEFDASYFLKYQYLIEAISVCAPLVKRMRLADPDGRSQSGSAGLPAVTPELVDRLPTSVVPSIPDFGVHRFPVSRPLAVHKLPPRTEPVPAIHRTKLGSTLRIGDLEVTPLRIERRKVQLTSVMDGSIKRISDNECLVLRLRAQNVSRALAFVPLDELFLRPTDQYPRYSYIELVGERGGTSLEMYELHPFSEFELESQSFDELKPGQAVETVIVAAEGSPTQARGNMFWRVLVRIGGTPDQSSVGVFGVEFTADQIQP